jgi:nicotinamidase-related amidase
MIAATFLLIDVQEKLWQAMPDRERLAERIGRALDGALALGVPVVWLEQVPQKIGPTLPALAARLPGQQPIVKTGFSGLAAPACRERLDARPAHRVVLAGIEAHVCVWQTARDLLAAGRSVTVLADATASRHVQDAEIAWAAMRAAGALVASTEMWLFDELGSADHPAFRDILRLVK